jgi:hypothetical protein
MDLEGITRVLSGPLPTDKATQQEIKGRSFESVLSEAVDKPADARPAEEVKEADSMQDLLYNVAFKNAVCDRLSRFLDTLEKYQKQLEDPLVNLREIASTVKEIGEGQRELAAVARGLPDKDELRDIYNEVVIRSAVEVARFQRGEYV